MIFKLRMSFWVYNLTFETWLNLSLLFTDLIAPKQPWTESIREIWSVKLVVKFATKLIWNISGSSPISTSNKKRI